MTAAEIEQALAGLRMGMSTIPFNQHIGFELSVIDGGFALRFPMKPELVGNTAQQTLHSGVIATAMDMIGGSAGIIAAYQKLSPEERPQRLPRFGTIDMSVNYLQPGRGEHFTATGQLVRIGKKTCVTQMALYNDADELIATATGSYMF